MIYGRMDKDTMTMKRLTDRAVIAVSGAGARDFLQGLVTQDMARLDTGAVFACLLTPQGKILFDFIAVPGPEDSILLDVWRAGRDALIKRLSLYRLRAKIDITARDDLAVGVTAPLGTGSGAGISDPRHTRLPHRVIAPAEIFTGNDDTYHAVRIGLGIPEWGADFDGDTLFLLDVNYDALGGVSYKKGCFIGQEVTSRMKRKAEARRRTAIAAFDAGSASAAKGSPLTAGTTTIGELLSDIAGDRALAAIRLDRWEKAKESGAPITCDGAALRLALPGYLEPA